MDNAEERNEMTTAQEVEDWRVKIKKKIWSEFAAEPNEAHGKFLMKKFDELCDTALLGINALAENARLKAAMDKYSEDEMLCNDTIEQPAQGMVMVSKVELEDAWRQADAGNCLGLSADLRHILDREEK